MHRQSFLLYAVASGPVFRYGRRVRHLRYANWSEIYQELRHKSGFCCVGVRQEGPFRATYRIDSAIALDWFRRSAVQGKVWDLYFIERLWAPTLQAREIPVRFDTLPNSCHGWVTDPERPLGDLMITPDTSRERIRLVAQACRTGIPPTI